MDTPGEHPQAQYGTLNVATLKELVRLQINNRLGHDVRDKVLPRLAEFGDYAGICSALKTSPTTGITSNDFEQRKEKFGRNYVDPPPLTPFWKFCLEALEDPTLQFLCVAAVVSLIIGTIFEAKCLGYLDGIAILCAVMVVVFVGAAQESAKQKQFRDLTDTASDEKINVVRNGEQKEISTREIVVGDCVKLSTGDILCADGLIFERNTLKIYEGALTGESVSISKGKYEFKERGHFEVPFDAELVQMGVPGNTPEERQAKYEPTPAKNPLLFKGTEVQDGEGNMIVIGVGVNTYEQGLMADKEEDDDDDDSGGRSILQRKLDDMTIFITKVGAVFGIVIVIVLFIRFAILFGDKACCREKWDNAVHNMQWLGFLITGMTIFVVAVPEGLPLAVTIALAFSVKKMMTDMNMVKTSSACETMGSATTICSDKTGTLTTSMMTVMKVCVGGEQMNPKDVQTRASKELKETMMSGMTCNTSEKTDIIAKKKQKGDEEQVMRDEQGRALEAYSGNPTECAMLKFVNALGAFNGDPGDASMPYRRIRKEHTKLSVISFSSKRKRMSTLVNTPEGACRLYCKGASEMVMALCTSYLDTQGKKQAVGEEMKAKVDAAITAFADEGLRTIAVAFRDFDASPAQGEDELDPNLEAELVLVHIVGIEDPLREEVPNSIQVCKQAGIVVRMVTGDNLSTAKAISRKAGILDPVKEASGEEKAMTGETFRSLVLSDQNAENPEKCIIQEEMDKIWPKLRVLARSTPTDKLVLVTGIQRSRLVVDGYSRQVVAVTGDGTNDAPALKQADVGFAMYINGTQVAQQAADIVILDDNFTSIVAAVKWGRCVYDNICKFLQFQLTVNITACTLATIGAAVLTESPITVIQLLWVNLIMDSFASLALATEDPNRVPGLKEFLLNRKPYPRTQALLSKVMVRNMVFHAVWQLAILLFLIFGIGDICDPGDTIDKCAGPPYPGGDKLGSLRSGRPLDFDQSLITSPFTCVPAYNEEDRRSFYRVSDMFLDKQYSGDQAIIKSGHIPMRADNYCSEAHGCGERSQHYTMVFNVFVFLQVFNEINARKIHGEFNMFQGIMYNNLFLIVVIGTAVVQVVLVQVPYVNTAFGCTALNIEQWVLCFALGFTSIPVNLLIYFLPYEWISLGSWAGGMDEAAVDAIAEEGAPEAGKPPDLEMTINPKPVTVHSNA